LKRPSRLHRLLAAPRWDLIVFDEAHHLTAYQSGKKVAKTQNFKLAEALREHSRDLLLLSATPHQGDHFRFWMLIRLLNPSLFLSTADMLANRHRLNSVVFRRTQADACDAHGKPHRSTDAKLAGEKLAVFPPGTRYADSRRSPFRNLRQLYEELGNYRLT
jgi:SNF2 family DNA or RNA helicase